MLYRLTGIELRESVIRRLEPGRSIGLLEPAQLPSDLEWAEGNATISAAVSRWSSVMETAAREVIPPVVRHLVENELQSWQGESTDLSRAWLNPKVAGLSAANAAAVRLALLTALSPAQMSDDIIAAYRKHFDGDTVLIVTIAWAAFVASRRVADWLADKSGYFEKQSLLIAS